MMTLYTFESVHHMMRAEKVLKTQAIKCDVIPTPRSISTSCGLCLVISASDAGHAEGLFQQAEIAILGIYADAEKAGLYKGRGETDI